MVSMRMSSGLISTSTSSSLGQHRHGGRRGVDAPARLGERDALHAMHARLVLEAGEHALAGDGGDDLLVAAEVVLRMR